TLTGSITGSGAFTKRLNNAALTLSGSNSYTGATTIRDDGQVVISGVSGTIAASSSISLRGSLTLDNLVSANTNRVGTVSITSNGGTLSIIGNAATNITETVGDIILDGGSTLINLVGNSANTTLAASSLTRTGRSAAFVRGDALGGGAGAGFTNFTVTSAPTLVGGGGGAGSSTISIVPWIVSNNSSGFVQNGLTNTFVTYGANGFRPLNTSTEYATSLAAAGATSNVRLTTTNALAGTQTINSLALAGGDITGAGTLTITSGAVIGANFGTSVSANLAFGATEAVFHMTSTGTFSGIISGTNGLTKSGLNGLVLTGSNTYTGQTTIVDGSIRVIGNVPNGVTANPLGLSTSPIVMYGGPGSSAARLFAGSGDGAAINVSIARDITISNATSDSVAGLGNTAGTETVSFSGNVAVNGGILRFEADPSPSMTVSGVISGTGRVTDAFGTSVILSGSNTYSGGTTVAAGTYFAGHNNAFGTGPIVFSNTTLPTGSNPLPGAIAASGGARVVPNAVLVLSANATGSAPPDFVGMAVTGSQPLTLSGAIDLGGSTRTITIANTADTTFSGVVSRGGIDKRGAGRLILTGANTYTGTTIVNAGSLVFGANAKTTSLSVSTGAFAVVAQGSPKLLQVGSLTLAGGTTPTGTLDLNDQDMIVSSGSVATIVAQVAYARDAAAWDRPGITSTSAATDPNGTTTLGVLTGTEYLNFDSQFDGAPVLGSDVLVKYTYYGDSDFSGFITLDDYSFIDGGFLLGLTGWMNGDYDYSGGKPDLDDYALIDGAFLTQSGTLRSVLGWVEGGSPSGVIPMTDPSVEMFERHLGEFGDDYLGALVSSVPEPCGVSLGILAWTGVLCRRRRMVSASTPNLTLHSI
ncbi:MAG: beta strand repeat-containing protein, partial [Tepidisphaeraceae bacterium]